MKEQELLWDPPKRISNENAQPGVSGAAIPMCVAKGRWTNCDVYLVAPTSWFTTLNGNYIGIPPGIMLVLTSLENGIEVVVAQMALSQAQLLPDGSASSVSGKVFSIRGAPTTGWTLYAISPGAQGATAFPPGIVRMECWGDDSGESRALGQSPFVARSYLGTGLGATSTAQEIDYPVQVPPLGLSVLMGRDSIQEKLMLVRVDPTGALVTLPSNVDAFGNEKVAEQFAPVAEDNTNGVYAEVLKPLATATYAPSLATGFAVATKALVKATPGNVLAVRVSNQNAAVRYLLLHNKATAPGSTDVPLYAFAIEPGQSLGLGVDFFAGSGGFFSTGIGWAISTTPGAFTDAATAAEHVVAVHYK